MRYRRGPGIAVRLALAVTSLLLLATLAVGLLVYWNAEPALREGAVRQLDHVTEVVAYRFQSEMDDVREDIRFLAASPLVQRVAMRVDREGSAGGTEVQTLQSVWDSFLQHHPNYFQVRYISRRDGGREFVRVEREGEQIVIVAPGELQRKGHHDYFRQALRQPPDSMYVSPINLNKERGRIEQPERPTVRVAIPIYPPSSDAAIGIVVANVDVGYVLRRMQGFVPASMALYLTNSRGDFLLHPVASMTFGFERGTPHRIQHVFVGAEPFLTEGTARADLVALRPRALYLRRIPFRRGVTTDALLIGLTAPPGAVMAGVRSVQQNTIWTMLAFCLIAVAAAFLFARFMTRPLRRIILTTARFGQEGEPLDSSELPTDRGDEIGVLARTIHDMSVRLQFQMDTLRRARDDAEEASRMKSVFLANMSHEIRTPLTAIIGYSDVLADELRGQHRTFAEMAARGGRRLMETLTAVLTLAQLEAHRVELDLNPLNVGEEVREVASLFRSRAEEKGITLDVEVEPPARDAYIAADRGGLNSVLQNLIDNAIKFTETGGVRVVVERRAAASGEEANVLIHVEDSGIGISETYRATLFEPFTQESTGYTRSYEGSGLGLAIAKRLTSQMGGTISVHSESGRGSRFTLRFRECPSDEAGDPEETGCRRDEPLPPARPAGSKRVLVVEDNPETRLLLMRLLGGTWQTEAVATADAAIAAARQAREDRSTTFDAVLMDIHLGDGPDGREVLHRLRTMPPYDRVPVAAVTAYAMPGDREELLSEGFDAYLRKPFSPAELRGLLASLVGEEEREA